LDDAEELVVLSEEGHHGLVARNQDLHLGGGVRQRTFFPAASLVRPVRPAGAARPDGSDSTEGDPRSRPSWSDARARSARWPAQGSAAQEVQVQVEDGLAG